jgi:hypothetical protein
MRTPPTAGPAIIPNSPRSESSAEAAVSSSRDTSRGTIESRAGRWKPSSAAPSGATTNNTQTFGSSRSELARRITVAPASATSANWSMRLRSTASASAPPMNAVNRSGTSSAKLRSPTASDDPVSW